MSHDPQCRLSKPGLGECQCAHIRAVREATVANLGIEDCIEILENQLHVDPCDCDQCRAITASQQILRQVLRGRV